MDSRRGRAEQVWVGLFVLAASALLIVAVLSISGAFSRGSIPHKTYLKFAGGLEPGAAVRFGGLKAGSVESVRVDPKDSTQIEVDFNVARGIPLKVDSAAKIASLSPLGDNYLELTTGTRQAALAAPGSVVKSQQTATFDDLTNMVVGIEPVVQQTLLKLDQRLDELQVTVARANDLLSDKNRANITSSLGNLNSMLTEDRPKLSTTLDNVQAASARLTDVLNDLQQTTVKANSALDNINSVVLENRKDVRASVLELRRTLITASSLMDQLNRTMNYNSGNIDQILENIRITTQHLKELTGKLQRRPYTLIRADRARERKPGGK